MKKFIVLFLSMILVFAFAACSGDEINVNNSSFTLSESTISSEVNEQSSSTHEVIQNSSKQSSSKKTEISSRAPSTSSKITSSIPSKNTSSKINSVQNTTSNNIASVSKPAPSCEHVWQNATCKENGTCSKCGVKGGGLASHKYKDNICEICEKVDESKYEIVLPSAPVEAVSWFPLSNAHTVTKFTIKDISYSLEANILSFIDSREVYLKVKYTIIPHEYYWYTIKSGLERLNWESASIQTVGHLYNSSGEYCSAIAYIEENDAKVSAKINEEITFVVNYLEIDEGKYHIIPANDFDFENNRVIYPDDIEPLN